MPLPPWYFVAPMKQLPSAHLLMRRSLVAFCVLVVWLLLGAGSEAFGQQYSFIFIPGAPKSEGVLFQDSKGRLWLGGVQLAFFDGSRFFFLRDYGFPSVGSYDITEDSSGTIWIGAETGVYRFSQGRVEQVSKGVAVSVIAATSDVVIAAVGPLGLGIPTNASLVRIQRVGGGWKSETVMSLDSPGQLTLDHSGNLLYPWPEKGWNEMRLEDVLHWHVGARLPITRHAIPDAPGNVFTKYIRDDFGCLWMGAEEENTYDCGDGPQPAPFPDARMHFIINQEMDGTMVLWGDSVLAVGRPGSFHIATAAKGMPVPTAAISARDGTVWLATSKGLC